MPGGNFFLDFFDLEVLFFNASAAPPDDPQAAPGWPEVNTRSGAMSPRPRVAISACLNGLPVRYDGASQAQPELIADLGGVLDLVPLCPETGAGLPVPRPPVRLVVNDVGQIRMIGRDRPELDVTAAVHRYSEAALDRLLAAGGLCGWIFKSRSPSCGLGSTPHYMPGGTPTHLADGLQAALVRRRAPWLVLREETELADAVQRRQFVGLCRLVWNVCHSGRALREIARDQDRLLVLAAIRDSEPVFQAVAAGDRRKYCATLLAALPVAAADEWLGAVEAATAGIR